MPLAEKAPNYQRDTVFYFADLASSHEVPVAELASKVSVLASSQGINPVDGFDVSARLVLATRQQVEDPDWCERFTVLI